MRARLLTALLLVLSCRTVQEEIGQAGGTTAHALLQTSDGATIDFWRWTPRGFAAPKVLVVPEIGFDHRLVAPLCERLRDGGYDVATLDGRELTRTSGRYSGLNGWTIDVGRAVAAHGPRPIVVALGLGGSAVLTIAEAETVRGIVAVNLPLRQAVGNAALRSALTAYDYDPRAWLQDGIGTILFTEGRRGAPDGVDALRRAAIHPSPAMSREAKALLEGGAFLPPVAVPARALVGVKDNFISSEDALPEGGIRYGHVRRLAHADGFSRDYGHLEWLVDRAALAEVSAAILDEIEALP